MSDVNRTLTSLLLSHTICRHFWRIVVIEVSYILECPDGTDRHRLFQADERRTDDPAAGVQQILHVEAPHKGRDAGQAPPRIICSATYRRNTAAAGRENVHHWFLCKPALGGQRPSTAMPIRASFCHRTGACRNLSQPLFRVSRNQGVTHWTLQAKSCTKGGAAETSAYLQYTSCVLY